MHLGWAFLWILGPSTDIRWVEKRPGMCRAFFIVGLLDSAGPYRAKSKARHRTAPGFAGESLP